MSDKGYAYVVVVKYADVANQGIGFEDIAFSARTLPVAIDVLYQHASVLRSQSHPSFAEGEMKIAAIMTADEYTGTITIAAEDCGYEAYTA